MAWLGFLAPKASPLEIVNFNEKSDLGKQLYWQLNDDNHNIMAFAENPKTKLL